MIWFKCELITANSWSLSPSGLIEPHDPFTTAVDGHAGLYLSKRTENLCGLPSAIPAANKFFQTHLEYTLVRNLKRHLSITQ